MNIRIYSIEYRNPLSNDTLNALLSTLPRDMAHKVRRYHRWQDAYGSLFGKLLLAAGLQEQAWPAPRQGSVLDHLTYTPYGRPFLQNGPDFNISHSGHRVACIIATQGKVGIDLEEIKDIPIEDFREQFTPEEWTAITLAPSPLHTFYQLWTAKECLSKADGRGLNLSLANLHIGPIVRVDDRNWHLQTQDLSPGYACHTACEYPIHPIPLKEISVKELESLLLKK